MRASWLLAGLLAAAPAAAQGDPVAVVVRVTGPVTVQVGTAARAAATPGLRLRAGDRLNVPQGAQAVLLYRSGRAQTVTQSIRVQAPAAGTGGGVFQQTVRTLNEVGSTDARAVPNRQGMIRPIAGSPVPAAPRNLVVLPGTRPTFTWTRVPDAAEYVLQVRDVAAGAPVRFRTGGDTLFALPEDADELVRGHTYEWSVARTEGGRASPPQRFRIARQTELDSVQMRLAALGEAGLDPDGDGALLAAVIYREAGMLNEALAALERALPEGEAPAADLLRLRGEIHAQLGMLERAMADFTAAEGP